MIGRVAEPSERALREEWPLLERQLEEALAFAKGVERSPRAATEAYRPLQRSLRELDQYARAIRWVLTVTETPEYDI